MQRSPSSFARAHTVQPTNTPTDSHARRGGLCRRQSLTDALRATTAAPWYMEELQVSKDVCTGAMSRQGTASSAAGDDDVPCALRFIDGAIACNNPTAIGIFEARRLFPRTSPLCVVSLGTGAAAPREVPAGMHGGTNWVQNVISATCDVLQVDATIRHVLGPDDSYFRFQVSLFLRAVRDTTPHHSRLSMGRAQPTGAEVFGCPLNDTSAATAAALREAAETYMDSATATVETLAAKLQRQRRV